MSLEEPGAACFSLDPELGAGSVMYYSEIRIQMSLDFF